MPENRRRKKAATTAADKSRDSNKVTPGASDETSPSSSGRLRHPDGAGFRADTEIRPGANTTGGTAASTDGATECSAFAPHQQFSKRQFGERQFRRRFGLDRRFRQERRDQRPVRNPVERARASQARTARPAFRRAHDPRS